MRLRISKWGNSLAVRLPLECPQSPGRREVDSVEATVTPVGLITLVPDKALDKADFLARLRELHASLPMTASVVEEMRREDRD